MGGADDHLPVFEGVGHLIRAAHLGEANAAHYKDNETWHVLHGGLAAVFVPVAVAGAEMRQLVNECLEAGITTRTTLTLNY